MDYSTSDEDEFHRPDNKVVPHSWSPTTASGWGAVQRSTSASKTASSERVPARRRRREREKERHGVETAASRRADFRFVAVVLVSVSLLWAYLHHRGTQAVDTTPAVAPRDLSLGADLDALRGLQDELNKRGRKIRQLESELEELRTANASAEQHRLNIERIGRATPRPTAVPPPAQGFRQLPEEPLTYSLDSIVSRAIDNTVVLSFCSIKYIDPMMNWLTLLTKHGVKNWGLVCLDLELRGWLKAHNADCSYILNGWKHGPWDPDIPDQVCHNPGDAQPWDGPKPMAKCKQSCEYDVECASINFVVSNGSCQKCLEGYQVKNATNVAMVVKRTVTTLWFARWKLLVRLLVEHKISVMLADLDAIFLKNPLPFLLDMPPADLVAQRGSFPQWLSAKWGAALCMGFVYWRATPNTIRFISHMDKVLRKTGDDQIGVNVALDVVGIKWDEGMTKFADATDISYGTTEMGGMRVAMLPHNKFPRKCDDIPLDEFQRDVLVAHCYESKKSGEAKKKKAMKFGLWVVQDDWADEQKYPILASFDDFLLSVFKPAPQ